MNSFVLFAGLLVVVLSNEAIVPSGKEQLPSHRVDRDVLRNIIPDLEVGTPGHITLDGNSKMLFVTFFDYNQKNYTINANVSLPGFTMGMYDYPVNITDLKVVDQYIANINFTIASEIFVYDGYLTDIINTWREDFIKLIGGA